MSELKKTIIEGAISVQAVLDAGSREVHVVYLDRVHPDLQTRESAMRRGVPIEMIRREDLDARAAGATHGGVLACVGPRRFNELASLGAGMAAPLIVMLDGIEDPFNFGYTVRTIWAAGADGLVVRPRNWTSAAATVIRASAGASELIPTAIADTPRSAADHFLARDAGFRIAATGQGGDASSLYDADLTGPLFLLIGGERRGIQRSFLDQADLILTIPYGREFDRSLGTVSAAAAIVFEVMRQRRRA